MEKKLSFDEILTILENHYEIKAFAYGEFDKNETLHLLGPINEVDHYGGEGQGETWYTVFHIPQHELYIRIDGYYSSYEGVEFDGGWKKDCTQVTPQTKTITVYE
jgi:hypothetical protein